MPYSDDEEACRERVLAIARSHPEWNTAAIARSARVTSRAIRAILDSARKPADAPVPEKGIARKSTLTGRVGMSLDKFKDQFDPRVKIRKIIGEYLDENTILTDQQMRELCEVPINEWRKFADLEEFGKYQWRWRKVLYWARPATIDEMKKGVGVL